MLDFWAQRAERFADDPRANTNDVWLREVEIARVQEVLDRCQPSRVLDFGCANGYTTLRLADTNPKINFIGVDLSPEMVEVAHEAARRHHLAVDFRQVDVLASTLDERFDLAISIRVFQNMESREVQHAIVERLVDLLEPGGHLFSIESYETPYLELNRARVELGLTELPIHEHLTLLSEDFDHHVDNRMDLVFRSPVASSYYLVTRLLYSKLAQEEGTPIDYDHPIHRIAAELPEIGRFGPLRASLSRKRP